MEKNIIILAIVLSMLGFVALGGLYSLCWRETLREDIVYARETRHRRPTLESQRHSRPAVETGATAQIELTSGSLKRLR